MNAAMTRCMVSLSGVTPQHRDVCSSMSFVASSRLVATVASWLNKRLVMKSLRSSRRIWWSIHGDVDVAAAVAGWRSLRSW